MENKEEIKGEIERLRKEIEEINEKLLKNTLKGDLKGKEVLRLMEKLNLKEMELDNKKENL